MVPWSKDYINLKTQHVGDDELGKFRNKHGYDIHACPTCYGLKNIVLNGEQADCNCEEQRLRFKHYSLANIGELYMRLDWDDYEGDDQAKETVLTYIENRDKFIPNGLGLLLNGSFGTGKTMLSSLAAKEFVKLGYKPFFVTFTEMIEMFTEGWSSAEDKRLFKKKIIESPILVLDDIGKERITKVKLNESTFDHLLRQRTVALRPTIITTNYDLAEIGKGYGGAILSLITERSVWHTTKGSDYRTKARDRTVNEALEGWRRPIY